MLGEMGKLAETFHPELFEEEGKKLAEKNPRICAIIYSSDMNQALAYIWKIN